MQTTLPSMPFAFMIITGLVGFVVGVALTVAVFRLRRMQRPDSAEDISVERDASSPYQPSGVSNRVQSPPRMWVILLVLAVSLALGGITFFAAITMFRS